MLWSGEAYTDVLKLTEQGTENGAFHCIKLCLMKLTSDKIATETKTYLGSTEGLHGPGTVK